jgi:hypothetical protein
MKAPKMELDKTNMEVEPELYYEVEEEMISVKDKMWGLDRIRSSDGHTFRVERDVNKKCVNILFDEEMEVPINHKTDRPVSKAVKKGPTKIIDGGRVDRVQDVTMHGADNVPVNRDNHHQGEEGGEESLTEIVNENRVSYTNTRNTCQDRRSLRQVQQWCR